MARKTTEEILNEIFSKISNILTPMTSETEAPSHFVTIMLPGITVSPQDFDIKSEQGRANLYRTMDALPKFNKQYTDSANKCSEMYTFILRAKHDNGDPQKAKEMEEQYKSSLAFLNGGALDNYYTYKDLYDQALDEVFCIENAADLTSTERSLALRKAKHKVDRAQSNLVTKGMKAEVEHNLAICALYLVYSPETVFAEASKKFDEAKDLNTGLYPVTCTPSSWATESDALSWMEIVINQKSKEDKLHTDTKQIDSDFSANFHYGLWHASASGGYHDRIESINKSSSVDQLGLKFKIARVAIKRDWFTSALLNYPTTWEEGFKRGEICAGSIKDAGQCRFPFLPTELILAKDITIYNTFSSEEENFMNESKSWSASAEIGFGPFSLKNNTAYSKNLTDEEKKEFGNAVKMSAGDGIQIIGFVNSILSPAFPAKDADEKCLKIGETTFSPDEKMLRAVSEYLLQSKSNK